MEDKNRFTDIDRSTIITALKRIHDAQFTPGVYEHSIYGKAALLLEGDAEQVVYCYNCKKHDPDGTVGYCNHWRRWTKMSDYCSRGEKNE